MMIVKFIIPYFFLVFAYYAIRSKDEYYAFLVKLNKFLLIYLCVNGIAPIGNILSLVIGNNFFGGSNAYQASSLSAIPLSLYLMARKKKYLWVALLCFMPSFTYMRRAALLGICLSVGIVAYIEYKWKSIMLIAAGVVVVVDIIFAVPSLKARFFGGDRGDGDISFSDLKGGNAAKMVNTSGREFMWTVVIDKFFVGNVLTGSGLGNVKSYLKSDKNENKGAFELLHNDFLQLLCETGIVGVVLYILSILQLLHKPKKYVLKSKAPLIKYGSLISITSMLSMMIYMFFTNILSSPAILIIPFILIGFNLKLIDINAEGGTV